MATIYWEMPHSLVINWNSGCKLRKSREEEKNYRQKCNNCSRSFFLFSNRKKRIYRAKLLVFFCTVPLFKSYSRWFHIISVALILCGIIKCLQNFEFSCEFPCLNVMLPPKCKSKSNVGRVQNWLRVFHLCLGMKNKSNIRLFSWTWKYYILFRILNHFNFLINIFNFFVSIFFIFVRFSVPCVEHSITRKNSCFT